MSQQVGFDFACWVDLADDTGQSDFDQIARHFKLKCSGEGAGHAVSNLIVSDDSSWLVVFDNVAHPANVRHLIPQSASATVIVVSRYLNWHEIGRRVNVEPFEERSAISYLTQVTGRAEDEATVELAKALGRLPLALSLAASACRTSNESFAEFLDRIVSGGRVEPLAGTESHVYGRALEAVWRDSVALADRRAQGSRTMAQLMSVLDWRSISRDWLERGLGIQGKDIDRLLGALADFSLIVASRDDFALRHGILADGIASDTAGQEVVDLLQGLFSDELSPPSTTAEGVSRAEEPLRHLRHLLANHRHLVDERLLQVFFRATNQLHEQGSMDVDFHTLVIQRCEEVLGDLNENTIGSRLRLGASLWYAGRLEEAVEVSERVMQERAQVLGPEHLLTVAATVNHAVELQQLGRTEEAIAFLERALALETGVLDPEGDAHIRTKSNLAWSYSEGGQATRAVELFVEILEVRRRRLGTEHPRTLITEANLAWAQYKAGNFEQAAKIGELALEKRSRVLPAGHPDILNSRGNLALVYKEVGRIAEAIEIEMEVFKDRLRTLGASHYHSVSSRENLLDSLRLTEMADSDATALLEALARETESNPACRK